MWSRSASRGPSRPSSVVRTGVVGLAVLAFAGLGLTAANAAPVTTIQLDDPEIEMTLWNTANRGVLPLASPYPMQQTVTDAQLAWGGGLTFQLPQHVHAGSGLTARLDLFPDASTNPTRTYSTSAAVPADQLTLADLGGGSYRVDMPADDGINGPLGSFVLDGLTIDGATAATFTPSFAMNMTLSAAGPSSLDVPMQLLGWSGVPCVSGCPVPSVPAGGRLDVTLPQSSALITVGLPDLSHSAVAMQQVDSLGRVLDRTASGWTPPITQLAASLSADARTVSVSVPAGTAAGSYGITVTATDGTDTFITFNSVHINVVAAEVNPGLRSETGGDDDTSSLPLLALTGVAGAAAVGGVALQSRRRAASRA
jgi:hypothetical protein